MFSLLSTRAFAFDTCPFLSELKPVLHSFFCAALSGFPLSWCPCPWLSSNPTKSPVPTGRTIVKTLLPWDSDESPEASPGPPGPRRGAGAGGPREEVGATPGPEEQDSLLLQRKSARRCVKQRPSYDVFEDSDDSEPGGPPAPRRRTPREHGMLSVKQFCFMTLFLLAILGVESRALCVLSLEGTGLVSLSKRVAGTKEEEVLGEHTQLVCSVLTEGLPSEPWLEEVLGTNIGAGG